MATQLFPKSYLLERIDARIASLDRQDAEDSKTVNDWMATLRKERKQWVKTAKDWAEKLPGRIDELVEKDDIKALANMLQSAPRDPDDQFASWGSPRRTARDAASNAKERLRERARERDALTHTRAYLTDTPIEEFSTTALGRLGLIDAVKFSLDDARKEAEARAKKRR